MCSSSLCTIVEEGLFKDDSHVDCICVFRLFPWISHFSSIEDVRLLGLCRNGIPNSNGGSCVTILERYLGKHFRLVLFDHWSTIMHSCMLPWLFRNTLWRLLMWSSCHMWTFVNNIQNLFFSQIIGYYNWLVITVNVAHIFYFIKQHFLCVFNQPYITCKLFHITF